MEKPPLPDHLRRQDGGEGEREWTLSWCLSQET